MDADRFAAKYGPWALIAGASEGTGAAFARQLAGKGLNLILVARREAPLAALAEEMRERHGVECVIASIDLGRDDAAAKLAQTAGTREVGLFISNAGADTNGVTFLDNDLANWEALVTCNVNTMLRACHHFARPMRDRGRGGIILVGSGACYGGLPGLAAYCGSKAFTLLFGEALWAELRPHGVDVLNLILGKTDTPAHRALMDKLGAPFPTDCADADDVVALGLSRIAEGPVVNWGQADDEVGMAGTSAAGRRQRIEMITAMSQAYTQQAEAPAS